MAEPFFITTAIDYTNGAPHIGHAYEKVLADVLARYHRLKGDDVFFLTGVDQHGQKVQQSAEKMGVAPQQFVDDVTAKFRALWDKLNVRYDGWAATTDTLHKECVRANLQKLWDDKDPATGESRWIYKKTQRGFYSVRQEQFLTDKERGADGQFGPEWGVVEERDEENFYFRLTAHPSLPLDPATGQPLDPRQWLLSFIKKRSDDGRPFVIPDFRVSELENAVEKLEGDLCISRPAARLQWGIPFPESFGAGFVTYVWFDALVNYISFVPGHDPSYGERTAVERPPGTLGFADWWPALHVIGKDIMIPAHGVYWPIMLKALGFADAEMPTLLVHGWWNISGAKMSKSLGNVIDPDALADKYGPEALRYYLMSDIATGKDADFDEERLVIRYNSDLANSLGNLLNRTLSMAAKYREGRTASIDHSTLFGSLEGPHLFLEKFDIRNVDDETMQSAIRLWMVRDVPRKWSELYGESFERFEVSSALERAFDLAAQLNQLIQTTSPWKLAKDPTRATDLDAVLYTLAESLRIIAILISPVLPQAAHGIFDQLRWKIVEGGPEAWKDVNNRRFLLADAVWCGLPDGHLLGKPVPLFPRIEAAAEK